MGIIAFIIILSVLVLVHEAGHFFAARRAGVGVEEFGLGFPPRLFGWRRGNTVFTLNAIPFGGFVRLVGEQGEDAARPDSFMSAKPWRQLAILLAGVVMNFVFAWATMAVVLGLGVRVDPAQVPTDRFVITQAERTEIVVNQESAAARSGLENGDTVLSVNGLQFRNTAALIDYVQSNNYPELAVAAKRRGETVTATIQSQDTANGKRYGLGIATSMDIRYPWSVTPWYGLKGAVSLAGEATSGFGQLARDLFRGRVSQDVTGPIGIAVITTEVSRLGLIPLLQFAAILSISLAILNVLPLPALDGGRIFLRLAGWVSRRPVSRQLEGAIHMVGFYLLVAFLLYISVRDIDRFDVFGRLTDLFR